MNTFSLKLIACDKVFYDGPCEILIFDGFDGEMAIMANHEPMTCSVETGELRFRVPGETTWQEAIVSTGLLKVEHNKVDIIVYSAERPEEIDKFRAEACTETEYYGIPRINGITGKSYGQTSWCKES